MAYSGTETYGQKPADCHGRKGRPAISVWTRVKRQEETLASLTAGLDVVQELIQKMRLEAQRGLPLDMDRPEEEPE